MLAEKIFLNGKVITMDPRSPNAEAFAVTWGRFSTIGTDEEVRRATGIDTEVIDLEGRTVVPGFIETHNHLSWFSLLADWVDCGCRANRSIEDVKARVREAAAATPPGQWVRGYGYDDTLIEDDRHLTRRDLDEAAPDHPVFILHVSMHLAYANSKALDQAGIGPETPQPQGGEIHKDDSGVPTGLLKEMSAIIMVGAELFLQLDQDETRRRLQAAAAHVHRAGVTSIHDGGIALVNVLKAYGDLEAAGDLPLRVYATIMEPLYQELQKIGLATGYGSEVLKVGCVKLIQDGSIQGRTAALLEPYHDDPGFRGELIIPQETLDETIDQYHRAGHQIAVHGNGSAAIESILRAMEKAQAAFPRQDHRHMLIHCQTATADQITRMRRLGVIPSYFVNHIYYWGDRHEARFLGPERAARIDPLGSSVREGLLFTLHSDLPITPIDPLFSIHCAVNRRTREGKVLGPRERISPLEALKAYTTHAAYCSFEEEIKGSIETGKLADFAVLSENPLEVDPEKIKDIKVLRTVVGGETVFDRDSAG